ncbi:DUF1073 domain-containing protein [Hyphomicrobiales bacterium BP6-180914]|uniref:DUF1073 domain-containing protein n=1 Tax=Lichenifustis flavocetrariae TaxID=2949735 RepID=A0AA41Z5P7_9HYPH|nr:DUF1073 domain-containing protein [Lichenifustis flavocetrariae]
MVPYDCVREWREWAGEAQAVARLKALESRLNLRRAVQRAMVMGRLYGGGALIIGTTETDPAALRSELRPEAVGPNGIVLLHAVSRWQLAVAEIERDPLSPWFGEPKAYEVTAPERGALVLHLSRVIRFLGNPLADPSLFGADLWSDSVLTALYDAIHAGGSDIGQTEPSWPDSRRHVNCERARRPPSPAGTRGARLLEHQPRRLTRHA